METMNDKRRSLGRGLSALIPPKPASHDAPLSSRGSLQIAVEQILPGDGQPRQKFDDVSLSELAESIRAHGVIQPIGPQQTSTATQQVPSSMRLLPASVAGGPRKRPG